MSLTLFALATIVIGFIYYLATKHYKFWEKAGVRTLNPPTVVGAIQGTLLGASRELYNEMPNEPYLGIIKINSLGVIIRDPELIKLVLTKDFSHFHDRGNQFNEERDPLSVHLFNLEGRKWRILRAKLTPTFSSSKLRQMYFPFMKMCVDKVTNIMAPYADKNEPVDFNDILCRFSTDVILSCAFGLQGNALRDPNDIYARLVKLGFKDSLIRKLEHILFEICRPLHKFVPLSDERKQIHDFFLHSFSSTVREREQSVLKRNDFLDLLLEIRKNGYLADGQADEYAMDKSLEFTDRLMAAQAFVFFLAGAETSSSTASFAALEIANNPVIQRRLQEEVDAAVARHGAITYEAISDMPYLDMVVNETLRKYPSARVLLRQVTRPYPMPDGKVTLPVGLKVYISVTGLHYDPKYYPDPERFDPERFSATAVRDRNKYVYLPFGEGPRTCIGMRFGLLQVKLSMASIVHQFELRPKPGHPYPPKINPNSKVTSLELGAPLLLTKRHKTRS